MKILFLCTFYHRALFFRQQMDALNARGHEVRAFNSARYGEGVAPKFQPIMDDMVVHTECWNKYDRLFFFPRQWKIEKKLESLCDLKHYDLIHAHLMLSSGYTARKMKKKYGVPYVVSVRTTDLYGFIRIPYFRRMAVKILKDANAVLFLSQPHKEELYNKYLSADEQKMVEEKSAIIGNALENFWMENVWEKRTNDVDKNQLKILSVAKIRAIKNLPVAAKAVGELRKRGINATLTVVGEVQEQAEYEKIKQFEYVEVLPFMTKEELIDVYRTHDIFLLPSVDETFGRVYPEAMTQGMPVIYTKGQGFDKTFPEGTVGYAVAPDNPEEIADRVEDIMADYQKMSASCVELCENFFEDKIIDKIEAFYKKALNLE